MDLKDASFDEGQDLFSLEEKVETNTAQEHLSNSQAVAVNTLPSIS